MKKVILILLIFLTGCQNKATLQFDITTIIEEDYLTCITYPTTNIKIFDDEIKKYVNDIKKDFDSNKKISLLNKWELNIDYTYEVGNNAINVEIISYVNSNSEISVTSKNFIYNFNDKKVLVESINAVEETINYNYVIDPSKPVIAFTFDDGPSKYTNEIIELFKENEGTATFFILGNKVKSYEKTLKKMVSLGNEIGNHSYNHKWLSRLSIDEIKYQIETTQNLVYQITKTTPLYLRPTYGGINNKIRNNTNLEIIFWDIDSNDWKIKDKNKIVKRVLSSVKDGKIILMHDIHKRTLEALKVILPELKKEGYQLVTVSDLKEIELLRENTNE